MTIAAYQTLYESSVAFGMRKALMAEQGKADMEQMLKELQEEKRELEHQVCVLAGGGVAFFPGHTPGNEARGGEEEGGGGGR